MLFSGGGRIRIFRRSCFPGVTVFGWYKRSFRSFSSFPSFGDLGDLSWGDFPGFPLAALVVGGGIRIICVLGAELHVVKTP